MEELSELSESVRKLALARFHLLQSRLEERRALRPLAIEAGISYRTAHRWLRRYQRDGLAALVRKKRIDSRVGRTVPVKIKAAVEGLALQNPPLPFAARRRQVKRIPRIVMLARIRDRAAPATDKPQNIAGRRVLYIMGYTRVVSLNTMSAKLRRGHGSRALYSAMPGFRHQTR